MPKIVAVESKNDIPAAYRDTPVGRLLEYHNLGRPFEECRDAELLVGMCMDHRKRLRIPERFAYIVRTGGGNLRNNEFQVSFALSVAGVRAIAVIAHTDCGMSGLAGRREAFVDGLAGELGWERESAETHFAHLAPLFEVGDPADFTVQEANRLRARYANTLVAPLLYRVEDNRLYLLE